MRENSNYHPIDHSCHRYPIHNVVEDGIMSGVYIIFAVDSHHFPEGRGSFLYFLDLYLHAPQSLRIKCCMPLGGIPRLKIEEVIFDP
jgi:hypothetical protein